jgi:hypothetical protein
VTDRGSDRLIELGLRSSVLVDGAPGMLISISKREIQIWNTS